MTALAFAFAFGLLPAALFGVHPVLSFLGSWLVFFLIGRTIEEGPDPPSPIADDPALPGWKKYYDWDEWQHD